MIEITIQMKISDPEMIRFFRERGIAVKEIEERKLWVVVNPNTGEESPIEEKYKEIVSLHTRNLIINNIDKFAVYSSFM